MVCTEIQTTNTVCSMTRSTQCPSPKRTTVSLLAGREVVEDQRIEADSGEYRWCNGCVAKESTNHITRKSAMNGKEQVKLQLEYADYSAMYIRDVNNYIAVYHRWEGET